MAENDGRPPVEGRRASRRGGGSVPKRAIHDEMVVAHLPGVGAAVVVVPIIPEDAPYKVREGVARRRVATLTGRCPCAATGNYEGAVPDRANVIEVVHDRLCPADDRRLKVAIRRWLR